MPKTIVITGASAGIGAGLARRFAADGHALILAARRKEPLEAVARAAEQAGSPRTIAVEADVTKRRDVERLADRAVAELGAFDVWINNAGRGITRQVLDLSDGDIDEMMAVNVKSALYGMQAAGEHFVARGSGHIINVSSFLGRVPMATQRSAYNAAKAALNALTANLRVDLGQKHPNIHVTLVMPGMVGTEFGRNALGSPADTPIYSGPYVQSVEQVADIIAGVIDKPVAEVYTNPASAGMAQSYFADVAAFEAKGAAWGPGR
ncbi:MAG TPA: SDR family NAD(P)-dependent oxidoreductase [Gemmatimonadaceae bacterium]|jgi:short-subunit dehydrogenase|nr:SDR family NAD(P)-dependent oxidoreductase [Gemmatimonadaceae bacterium]